MTRSDLLSANTLIRLALRGAMSDIGFDVAISLMWQVPYTEGEHLI